jgi:prepilin-type N-terminal cleavage/methylation domain-containing protein
MEVAAPRCPSRAGFTLTELLVVISILAMLAAAGVIQLVRARVIVHEELALASVRVVAKACQFFFLANQRYPTNLTELGTANPPYIPANLVGNGSTVQKQGYEFVYSRPDPATFTLTANPVTPGVTGTRHFFTSEQLAIHMNASGPAGGSDPVIP